MRAAKEGRLEVCDVLLRSGAQTEPESTLGSQVNWVPLPHSHIATSFTGFPKHPTGGLVSVFGCFGRTLLVLLQSILNRET